MKTVLLMFLLVCGASSGYGQEKLQPHTAKQAASKKITGTESNPIFIKQAKTAEERAADDKQATDTRENLDIQRASLKVSQDALIASQETVDYTKRAAWAAIIAAAIGIVMAIIAVLQLRMFWLQLERMKDSNIATQKSADAAAVAATATKDSVEHAEKRAMPILLPAVISFDELFNNEKGGALYPRAYIPKLRYVFENLGETPAIIIEARATLTFLPMSQDVPEFNLLNQIAPYGQGNIVRGNYSKSEGGQEYVVQTLYELTIQDQQKLKLPPSNDESMRFFFYGRVVYDDIFGVQHERAFGRRLLIQEGNLVVFTRGDQTFDYYKRYDRRKGERAPEIAA